MGNPNSATGLLWFLACCWPSPVTMGIVVLITVAVQKKWIKIKVDTTAAPKLKWWRNQ